MKEFTTAISATWIAVGLLCLTNTVSAEDSWTQLRGDNQGHASAEIKLASEWSETNNVVLENRYSWGWVVVAGDT